MNGVKTTKRVLFISGIVERETYASARETRPISNRAYAFSNTLVTFPVKIRDYSKGLPDFQ